MSLGQQLKFQLLFYPQLSCLEPVPYMCGLGIIQKCDPSLCTELGAPSSGSVLSKFPSSLSSTRVFLKHFLSVLWAKTQQIFYSSFSHPHMAKTGPCFQARNCKTGKHSVLFPSVKCQISSRTCLLLVAFQCLQLEFLFLIFVCLICLEFILVISKKIGSIRTYSVMSEVETIFIII